MVSPKRAKVRLIRRYENFWGIPFSLFSQNFALTFLVVMYNGYWVRLDVIRFVRMGRDAMEFDEIRQDLLTVILFFT